MQKITILILMLLLSAPCELSAAELAVAVLDDQGAPVADAVVSAIPLDGQPLSFAEPETVDLEQINKEFVPHVTVIPRGGKINFPNRDSVAHHVFSFSETKKFELPLYSGVPDPVAFDKAGIVTIGCNIHDWMKAYIVVVDTPLYGKSGADGKVRLTGLSTGAWKICCWHPRLRGQETAETRQISGAEESSAEFRLKLRREWKRPRGPASGAGGY